MTTTDLIPAPTAFEIAAASTAELRDELARGLTLTATVLARLGVVWAELERRGEDLSGLRHGLARVLPLIASGLLAAEAVVAFASRPSILRALEGLPLAEQRRLAEGGTVEVATSIGSQRTEAVPVAAIPAGRLRVVFQDGMVLSPAEQRVRLGRRRRRTAESAEETQRVYQPRYDPDTGTFTIGKMTVRLADMLSALSAAAGPDLMHDLPAEEYVTVKTRLTKDESTQFLALCQRLDLPEWELLRKAMRAFALLSRGSGG